MKFTVSKQVIPSEGFVASASPGNKFTRVHLDMAGDGITLSMVGAASAFKEPESRHSITLHPAAEGIALAMVGAASAPTT